MALQNRRGSKTQKNKPPNATKAGSLYVVLFLLKFKNDL
jgi:hypothetical protein